MYKRYRRQNIFLPCRRSYENGLDIISERMVYAETNGAQAIGWRRINGAWYYLNGNNTKYPGLMVSDCSMEIGEHTYIFEANGAMREGWYQDGQDWYYYNTSGLIASGWRAIKGYWYYLDPNNDNKLVSGRWKTIGNNWYHFRPSGAMSTHWLAIGGNWYYLAGDGAMRTGWQSGMVPGIICTRRMIHMAEKKASWQEAVLLVDIS